jgi:hypothetical protein
MLLIWTKLIVKSEFMLLLCSRLLSIVLSVYSGLMDTVVRSGAGLWPTFLKKQAQWQSQKITGGAEVI